MTIVWNGAMDRAWARQQQRTDQPEPDHAGFVAGQAPPHAAVVDPVSRRPSDRILTFLSANVQAEHTSALIAQALDLDQTDVAVYLGRFHKRGVLVLVQAPKHRQALRVYRVARREAVAL